MSLIKKLGIGLGIGVVVVGAGAGGTLAWAKSTATERLSKKPQVHSVDFAIPFPLSEAEVATLRAERTTAETPEGTDVLAGVDLGALATERAAARGKYLVEARYVCVECHGNDLGGGTMIDDPAIGTLKGRNLTSGQGGVTAQYKAADWDRMVRHGIKPDGSLTPMPSIDYKEMTDRELSDIVTYIRSLPPVNADVPAPTYGPLGYVLTALGKINLSGELLPHDKPHAVDPPAETSPDFGKHVTQVCAGCHNPNFTGGPIPGAPPDWAPAKNLTPHAEGLAGWTFADFSRAMREGLGKNGQPLRPPMSNVPTYAKRLSDRELQAMFEYLQSLPPQPAVKP